MPGRGYSIVGGARLDWEDKDVFTAPTWTFREHVNDSDRPAFLFSFTDAPVMKALDLYREEAKGGVYDGSSETRARADRASGHDVGLRRDGAAGSAARP